MRRFSVVAVLVLLAVFSGWADGEVEVIQEGVWSLYAGGSFFFDSAGEDEYDKLSQYSEKCVRVTQFTIEVSNAWSQPWEPYWAYLWKEDDETGKVTLADRDGDSFELRRMESGDALLFIIVGSFEGLPSVTVHTLGPPNPRCDVLK